MTYSDNECRQGAPFSLLWRIIRAQSLIHLFRTALAFAFLVRLVRQHLISRSQQILSLKRVCQYCPYGAVIWDICEMQSWTYTYVYSEYAVNMHIRICIAVRLCYAWEIKLGDWALFSVQHEDSQEYCCRTPGQPTLRQVLPTLHILEQNSQRLQGPEQIWGECL